jgi:Rrf2 family protein
MKLTHAASYGIHAILHIAGNKAGIPQASHDIAKAHKIPERFLLKILKPMVSAGLLHSVKGPHGGYRLAKSPAQISLLEVIEAVEGPIRGKLAFTAGGADAGVHRKLEAICEDAAGKTKKILQGVKLAQLV